MHCSLRFEEEETLLGKGRPLLQIQGLSKSFQGVHALEGVSFEVFPGEALGLIGPNGAGKTTLINLVTGFLKPDQGAIFFGGQAVGGLPPEVLARKGLARTFQHIQIFPELTVFENVLLGLTRKVRRRFWHDILGLPKARQEEARFEGLVREVLTWFDLEEAALLQAGTLPYGDQRRVVLARALVSKPRLLLLDEPAAGLSPAEVKGLLELLKRIKAEGLTFVLVDHDVELVLEVCDRVVVLASGKVIACGRPEEIRQNPLVIEAYLGEQDA